MHVAALLSLPMPLTTQLDAMLDAAAGAKKTLSEYTARKKVMQ